MPNKDIFCNSPWYELHIFWDGSFGYCCQQTPHRPYADEFSEFYNIKNMSISDWHNSPPMRSARLAMNTNNKMEACYSCWHQEEFSVSSRRHRSNIKSVIFKQEFNESFKQSPNFNIFDDSFNDSGDTLQMPIDLHIDLGNYCNLACKFCCPEASSKIASQYKKWGILSDNTTVRSDWTKHSGVWDKFLEQLMSIDKLKNIHFMGGETLITPRFEELVDELIKHERFNVCLSFVSNGMMFNSELMSKLSKFERVGIEISVETLTPHNEYIRQGTDNAILMENIHKYIDISNGSSITITVRPVVSALSIGYYHTLLQFCIDNKIPLKSNNVIRKVGWMSTECLDVRVIPINVREKYKQPYVDIINDIGSDIDIDDFNESNPHNYKTIIKNECMKCIAMLEEPFEHEMYGDLIELLEKWDKVYGLNAYDLYPELHDILTEYNYNVS
jgi:pyruvate-formate lyase-activating enzyme